LSTAHYTVGYNAFFACTNLTALYFKGDAPAGSGAFGFAWPTTAVAYYLPGTSGWSAKWDIIPTALWLLPNPMMLTFEPNFGVRTNNFGFTVSCHEHSCRCGSFHNPGRPSLVRRRNPHSH
jgi:hypothetical protein